MKNEGRNKSVNARNAGQMETNHNGEQTKESVIQKFLSLESWAYRARHLAEKGLKIKCSECLKPINDDVRNLNRILEFNPDGEL